MKRLQPIERAPPPGDAVLLFGGIEALQRQDALLEPLRQRQVVGGGCRELIEYERCRFGAVADDCVALFEDP